MNSSRASSASSFDAQDYYKQLTSCLAAKNNLKVNRNVIPGYQQHLNNRPANRKPLITRQRIQAEFLAKCNARTLAAQQGASSGSSNDGSKHSIEKKAKPVFVVKGNAGRKKQEDFINLPDSFFGKDFKPENIPNFAVFKKPKAPAQKKQETPVHELSIPEPVPTVNQSMTSIATVTSAQFKPRLGATSTPNELPRPIISDPADFGHYFTNPKPILTAPVRSFRHKAKTVFEAFGKVAEKLDSNCLSKFTDPLTEIRGRLRGIYAESCRQPRLINETLMTVSTDSGNKAREPSESSSAYVRPVPVFYDTPKKKIEDVEMKPDPLSETYKLFNSTVKCRNTQQPLETPAVENNRSVWDITFNESHFNETPLQSQAEASQRFFDFDFSTTFGESPALPDSQMSETEMLFGPAPKIEVDSIFSQTVKVFSNRHMTASPLDNTFALFTSPPKPGRRPSQRSQREKDANRRSRNSQFDLKESQPEEFSFLAPSPPLRRRDPSQRSQREELRRSQLQEANIMIDARRYSSMSTYRWTPHIGNTSFETQSSRSHHYPFERQNILKKPFSFD